MKLPFSEEEYKKKKESHEILVPGDLCYHVNYFNSDAMGFMVVIEGNYADLYLQMPYSQPVENRHLNQYSGFTYHEDFRNPELNRSLIERGAWYDRDKLVFIRHLNKLEYGTVLKLVKTRGDVPKDFVDAIFAPMDEYRDMYNNRSKNLQKVQCTDIDKDTTIGMILMKLPADMRINIDNICTNHTPTLQPYINYKVDPNKVYVEDGKDCRWLHVSITELKEVGTSIKKPKQILDIHEITPIATIKRPKGIKLKKIESKVKKEEPEEPKIGPLYGPGDLVHLKDDDKHDLYIVLGSEAYRCSSVGFVYPNISYPSFHTYFVMNTNTHICIYTVSSNMVLYEQHFSQIALKEYYNRFLEEKI